MWCIWTIAEVTVGIRVFITMWFKSTLNEMSPFSVGIKNRNNKDKNMKQTSSLYMSKTSTAVNNKQTCKKHKSYKETRFIADSHSWLCSPLDNFSMTQTTIKMLPLSPSQWFVLMTCSRLPGDAWVFLEGNHPLMWVGPCLNVRTVSAYVSHNNSGPFSISTTDDASGGVKSSLH